MAALVVIGALVLVALRQLERRKGAAAPADALRQGSMANELRRGYSPCEMLTT